jgi:hypothetical protein
MQFIKNEIISVKNKMSHIFNQNYDQQLPFTINDISIPTDTTLYSIKIEK